MNEEIQLKAALRASESRYTTLLSVMRRQVRDAQLLDQVRTLIAQELDLPTLFRTVVEKTAAMFGYTHVSLYLREDDSLVLQHQVGYESVIDRVELNTGIAGRVASTGQPILLEDVRSDTEFLAAVPGLVSEICVPLLDRGAVVGVLNVESTRDVVLSQSDLKLMIAISQHVNIAIGRARLYAAAVESEERYRRLVELSPDTVVVHSEGIVVYVNEAAVRLMRAASAAELIGQPVLSFVAPDFRAIVIERMRQTQQEHHDIELIEEQFIRADGSIVYVEVAGIPTTYLGKPATQLVVRDITERKQAETQRLLMERRLLESQKMESLGVLAGGIAHDFNNLLLAILGNASLALLDVSPFSAAHESLRHIEAIAQRATDLTQQMLAYSGKGHFVVQKVSLNQIVQEMEPMLHAAVPSQAPIKFDLAPDLPPIEADIVQIRQLIMNLIDNAAEAIPVEGGSIRLETRLQRLEAATPLVSGLLQPGDYVILQISDTGGGMDAAVQARVFDPFFTTKFTGRGLGLAVVLGIIRGHKGAINVDSQPGQGTRFTIFLPSQQVAVEAAAEIPRPVASGRGGDTVLVIDDEEMIRSVTQRVLKRLGYQVLLSDDGIQGLEMFEAHADSISCVLLDLTMPRMNGEETFRAIQRIRPDTQVILMSGFTEEDATRQIGAKGLAGFLQKPFTINELNEKINAIMRAAAAG
ncbi:MAG TPA: PAS domain S-box protein [Herpetosiphonaceae bacterium]|nr:PAS domain S-box protein [Herpetosiphonaceae bacterium]